MGTNCLGPFLFTNLLLPILRKTASTALTGVRVTWAGSLGADLQSPPDGIQFDGDGSPRNHTSQGVNYGQSKAGNFYLAREFSKRLKDDGVISVVCPPGLIQGSRGNRADRIGLQPWKSQIRNAATRKYNAQSTRGKPAYTQNSSVALLIESA